MKPFIQIIYFVLLIAGGLIVGFLAFIAIVLLLGAVVGLIQGNGELVWMALKPFVILAGIFGAVALFEFCENYLERNKKQ